MKTSKLIAERLKNAHMVLNIDGASGLLSETGQPLYWTWQGAEKTYIDFQLEVTNPGGHSSAPRPDNAIAQLSQAVGRIAAYHFTPEINDITKAYFEQVSAIREDPLLAAAMRAFAADPTNAQAIGVLRADLSMNGVIGTTCVPTMVIGGHAPNALPQRATAVVNCRVFPGHANAEIQAELERVAATPEVTFTDITGDTSTASPPSPLRPNSSPRSRRRSGPRGARCRSTRRNPRAPRIRCGIARSMCRATARARASSRNPTSSRTGSTSLVGVRGTEALLPVSSNDSAGDSAENLQNMSADVRQRLSQRSRRADPQDGEQERSCRARSRAPCSTKSESIRLAAQRVSRKNMRNEDTSASMLSSVLIGAAISGTPASDRREQQKKEHGEDRNLCQEGGGDDPSPANSAHRTHGALLGPGYISTFRTVVPTAPLIVTEKRLIPALKCSRSDSRFTRAPKA